MKIPKIRDIPPDREVEEILVEEPEDVIIKWEPPQLAYSLSKAAFMDDAPPVDPEEEKRRKEERDRLHELIVDRFIYTKREAIKRKIEEIEHRDDFWYFITHSSPVELLLALIETIFLSFYFWIFPEKKKIYLRKKREERIRELQLLPYLRGEYLDAGYKMEGLRVRDVLNALTGVLNRYKMYLFHPAIIDSFSPPPECIENIMRRTQLIREKLCRESGGK